MNNIEMENIKTFLNSLLNDSTPEKPAWNLEMKLESKPPHWNYIDGCMLKAILDMYKVVKDENYLVFADNFVDYYINEDGNILGCNGDDCNCDNINGGKVLFTLYKLTGKEKYKKAIEKLYSDLMNFKRTEQGNFWHKKIYENQVWLDGLYMVQPFYMEYEMTFNKMENYKDIFNQFKNVNNIMKDAKTKLLYHGYDECKKQIWANSVTGLSPNFWTRSIGWYGMALVDTIEKLDEQFFHEYMTLINYLKELMDALIRVKDSSNMFYQVTDKGGSKGNYLETSGTCAISYCLMKGARLNYLPSYYYDIGEEIFESVVKNKLVMDKNSFVLKDICLVAGLGGMPGKGNYKIRDGSYEYYISEPKVNNDAKGVAPFLFAFSEICILQR